MVVGSQEFINMMDEFEKDVKNIVYGKKFERSNSGIKGDFYNDGMVDSLFKAFQFGYSFARINYLNQ